MLIASTALSGALAQEVDTGNVQLSRAPSWIKASKVNRLVDRVQNTLEWDIRKAQVIFYESAEEFQRVHGFGPSIFAVSRKSDQSIHIGPKTNATNFDAVFAHELSHIILFQKYKDAVPRWLEEGLASYVAKERRVDYRWLKSQPRIKARELTHPFQGTADPRLHYMMSTALIEMIASRCSLQELLQLSVGEKLEGYLSTFCEIKDIDAEFQKWIQRKN
jgi:hypothetical protein